VAVAAMGVLLPWLVGLWLRLTLGSPAPGVELAPLLGHAALCGDWAAGLLVMQVCERAYKHTNPRPESGAATKASVATETCARAPPLISSTVPSSRLSGAASDGALAGPP
jgi:hypothetical protein